MATGRLPDANTAPLTAKGDLYTYSTANARLAVGSNGDTLVADSAATTGLRWQGSMAAGRNFLLNGAFDVAQRGTSFTAASVYSLDRWFTDSQTFRTVTRQNVSDTTNLPFIQYCARVQRNSGQTGTTAIGLIQSIETVNSIPLAGRTVTLSFYARAGSNYSPTSSLLQVRIYTGTGTDQRRDFSTAFTGEAEPAGSLSATLTTTWQRFSFTATLASTATEIAISTFMQGTGTAGANDFYEITGVQLELGSVATAFTRSGGTIQGETALCQRYYYLVSSGSGKALSMAAAYSATRVDGVIHLPVTMRTPPTIVQTTGSGYYSFLAATSDDFNDITALNNVGTNVVGWYTNTNVAVTSGQAGYVYLNNASSSVALNAEL